MAAWLAAWLAGQLGWTPESIARPGPGHRIATFRGPTGEVEVTMIAEPVPGPNPLPQILGWT